MQLILNFAFEHEEVKSELLYFIPLALSNLPLLTFIAKKITPIKIIVIPANTVDQIVIFGNCSNFKIYVMKAFGKFTK